MRGHIRQRGKVWYYLVDVGEEKMQRCLNPGCPAHKTTAKRELWWHSWVGRKPLAACPKCGGELTVRLERRQKQQGGFRTQKEAEAALNTALGKIQEGTYAEPDKITVEDYLTTWLTGMASRVKPSTLLGYRIAVERHIIPALGTIPLQKLTGDDLEGFYTKLLTEPRRPVEQPLTNGTVKTNGKDQEDQKPPAPLSALTVRHIHAVLRKALGDAVRRNRIPRNPAVTIDPPRVESDDSHEMLTWKAEELSAFLKSERESRLYPLWLTLATTGMRRGEALGLRWEDVDIDASRLSIKQNRVSVGYEVRVGRPKSGKGRNISLDPATVASLKAFRTLQKREKLRWPGYVNSGYVFVQENGQPYHPDYISKTFEAAVKRSGQPRIRLHDLRHTFATLALQAGIHPKVVSERLGHAKVNITLDIYSHAIPGLQEEAATTVAALFVTP